MPNMTKDGRRKEAIQRCMCHEMSSKDFRGDAMEIQYPCSETHFL